MKTQSQMKTGNDQAESCAECGMAKSDWPNPKGATSEGEVYCCKGCAKGSGCTCEGSTNE